MNAETADAHDIELPKTVLVVEDEILIRWVTSEHLRECGYRVVEAGSGDDAVEVLRRSAYTISVVFSDVMYAMFRGPLRSVVYAPAPQSVGTHLA
jgi:DNA-binding NtrC family response regulator